MKLGLGTAQFGLDYGITNRSGATLPTEVASIVEHASAHGVHTIDTAALYGNAEEVLGSALPRPHPFRIVTKTLILDATQPARVAVEQVRAGVLRSRERLGESHLAGLLAHRVDDLLGPHGDRFQDMLQELKSDGWVDKIGASLYTPEDVDKVLQRRAIDIVQIPLNVFDQRHVAGGSLAALRSAGVEVHVRSAFLQGLLLAPLHVLPAGLAALRPRLERWQRHCTELGLSPLQVCLGFLKGLPGVDVAVCGATRSVEWQEIVAACEATPALPPDSLKDLAVSDDKLIDPRNWPPR